MKHLSSSCNNVGSSFVPLFSETNAGFLIRLLMEEEIERHSACFQLKHKGWNCWSMERRGQPQCATRARSSSRSFSKRFECAALMIDAHASGSSGGTSPYRLQELLLARMVLFWPCVVWRPLELQLKAQSTPLGVFLLKVMLGAMPLPCHAEILAGTFR